MPYLSIFPTAHAKKPQRSPLRLRFLAHALEKNILRKPSGYLRNAALLIGAIEAGVTAFISAKGGFQAFAEFAGPAIKKLQAGGESAINELTAAYRSAEGILTSIKQYITDEAAKGLADETALKNAYGYLIEQASKGTEYARLTARELKLLLNQAGEVSEKTLQSMLEWAKYQKSGTAEKIEQGLKESIEKLPEGEELGLDGVKAVIEKAELADKPFWIEEVTPPGSNHPVKIYTDGNAQINTGKIEIYIRGKVKLDVAPTEARIAELEKIKKNFPEEFTEELGKELEMLKQKLHNYKRSIEMNNTLETAGIPDTVVNNEKIAENLLEAAKQVTAGNTEVISYIEGTAGKVQIVSRWNISEDGKKYLATVILKPVK